MPPEPSDASPTRRTRHARPAGEVASVGAGRAGAGDAGPSDAGPGDEPPRLAATRRQERADRADRADRPDPPDRPGRPDRAGRPDRPDRADRPDRPGRARHRAWVEGGSSVRRWGYDLLGWAVLLFGAGVLASALIRALIPGAAGNLLSTLALWAGMVVPIVLAFARSRPRGLLRFRWLDVLYGVVLGGALRLVQGWLDVAAGATGAFPSYPTVDGALPPNWWITDLLTPVIVGPTVEEFFFRGVLLVAIYTVARRAFGRGFAGYIALLATTGLFVLAHAVSGALAWDDAVTLALVGLVTGMLVLFTERIWGAVLVHITFNATFVALALVGTLLA